MGPPETALLIFALLLALALGAGIWSLRGRRQHEGLRRRFGPEYEYALAGLGDDSSTDRELYSRTKRVQRLPLRVLDEAECERFAIRWAEVQTRFVDNPGVAVRRADQLILELMRTLGYPEEGFEQRVLDLSVRYSEFVQHYRAGRALLDANRGEHADTEELRQAFVHFRALFGELLADGGSVHASAGEAHA